MQFCDIIISRTCKFLIFVFLLPYKVPTEGIWNVRFDANPALKLEDNTALLE